MRRIPKLWLILGSAFLLILACLGTGYMLLMSEFSSNYDIFQPADCRYKSGNSISPEWFTDFAKIALPSHARDVSATCEAFQDYVAYARLTIDPSDLDKLIKSSIVKTPLSSTEKPYDMRSHYSDMSRFGWDIESINTYLAGEGDSHPSGFHQNILVDTRYPSAYTVYVVTFSTP